MKESKPALLTGGIIFGAVLTISFIVVVRMGTQIGVSEKSSFLQSVLLWFLEWILIIGAIGILWLIWKKMIEPYK